MKITKLFKLLLFGSILYLNPLLGQEKLPNRYHDTAISFENYSVELKDTYIKKLLFLRTTVVVNNFSDQFMVLNPKDVLFTTDKLVDKRSLYENIIVVPPHYSIKFYLKFSGSDYKSQFITFNFSKVRFSKDPHVISVNETLRASKGADFSNDTISFWVAGIEVLPNEFLVDVKLNYENYSVKGDKFLAINFNSIGLYSDKTDTCYNVKKAAEKFHFEPGAERETYRLLFPRNCVRVDDQKKFLLFKDVFTEYTLSNSQGFKMTLRSDDDAGEVDDSAEKKKDIELIK